MLIIGNIINTLNSQMLGILHFQWYQLFRALLYFAILRACSASDTAK